MEKIRQHYADIMTDVNNLVTDFNHTKASERRLDKFAEEAARLKKEARQVAFVLAVRSFETEDETTTKIAIIKRRFFDYETAVFNDKTQNAEIRTTTEKISLLDAWELLGYETFKHDLQLLGLRATLAVADLTNAENRAKIKDCYALSKLAEEKLKADKGIGADPLSKSQTVNALQGVIDSILFIAGDNNAEKNKLRAVNYHWNFFLLAITQGSKKAAAGAIKIGNLKTLDIFIGDILNGILTNRGITVEYKQKKEKGAESAPVTENPAPVSEEKPKKTTRKTAAKKSTKTAEK